ncbi:hypothetical protein [Georgenia sp. TF02-10]|uniref:hypothetical protein n=1 Tax=Georgenia sp. TF02-10 TaxID=2917725 RepID=UPI00352D7E16
MLFSVAVGAGSYHTVGVTASGQVLAAGDNSHGQCDVGDWENIVAVAAGSTTLGLRDDGTVERGKQRRRQTRCRILDRAAPPRRRVERVASRVSRIVEVRPRGDQLEASCAKPVLTAERKKSSGHVSRTAGENLTSSAGLP